MGGPLTCPALGAHWMDVGFNHPDPSIDLTSAKMLGAVSLLFFITQYPALAEDGKIYFFRYWYRSLCCTRVTLPLKIFLISQVIMS